MGEQAEFSFTQHDESDGSVRVCLVGELDAVEAPSLQEALRRLEGEGSDVLLDISGLTFMDVIGLHLIEEAADAARQGGFGFAIAGPVPNAVRSVFVEAGAQHHLPGGQARLAEPPSGPNGDATPVGATDRDRAGADSEQTRSDRDQTAADQDQTWSDSDQTAADADQRGSDRDQVASDDDQWAADRDQAASGSPHEAGYERSREVRRRTSRERDDTTETRARAGDARDATAAQRDATALERDATASQRDVAAYGRDRLADVGDLAGDADQAARRARGDRQRAHANREEAARDRQHAARDRQEAAAEREPPATPGPDAAGAGS